MSVSRTKNSIPSVADIYTITRLNREVRSVLEEVFPAIRVQGEISNLAKPASGHFYFTLKDSAAQVRCAMFKNRQSGLRFDPENGMQVLARANIGLYEGRGEYQLIIESLEPAGEGALQLAFEALKQKLFAEGLFNEDHKKDFPDFPESIGVITSATGAAIRDILSILKRRYPFGNVIVYPVPVQGVGAAKKIADTIKLADYRNECDVLILTRGGGSLEDLWAFNEEIVARSIFDITTPIVSGIGHEIDFTIADFVADQRAATPSAAAELISPDTIEVITNIKHREEQLIHLQKQIINNYQNQIELLSKCVPHPKQRLLELIQRTDEYSMRLKHQFEKQISHKKITLSQFIGSVNESNPAHKVAQQIEKVSSLQSQFKKSINHILEKAHSEISRLSHMLDTVSPISTLGRGYAIVTDTNTNKIITNTNHLRAGDKLRIRLSKAEINSTIDNIHDK
ncbi:MAG: exodeoxyribonuclease VII large subunit [Proteobacteria bacterium]|nr:exodeoxyribonuclease VII large subunit [Pseudomonadota bacterium]